MQPPLGRFSWFFPSILSTSSGNTGLFGDNQPNIFPLLPMIMGRRVVPGGWVLDTAVMNKLLASLTEGGNEHMYNSCFFFPGKKLSSQLLTILVTTTILGLLKEPVGYIEFIPTITLFPRIHPTAVIFPWSPQVGRWWRKSLISYMLLHPWVHRTLSSALGEDNHFWVGETSPTKKKPTEGDGKKRPHICWDVVEMLLRWVVIRWCFHIFNSV